MALFILSIAYDTFTFDTTIFEENDIIDFIETSYRKGELGGPFSCSQDVSYVLSGIGPFKGLEFYIFFPGNLASSLSDILNPPKYSFSPSKEPSYNRMPSIFLQK